MIGVKIGVTKDDGEVFYRKIEDLSPYGQLRNYQRGSGFEGTNEGKDLFRTLKLYALQEYLEDEETPSEDVMEKYKVTVYYRDADGDRIVISTPKELCSVITEACREYKSSPLPSPRNNVVKLMAKVVAKVEPASSPPTPLPPLVPAASTPTRPTATTSTQTAQDKDSAAAPTAATEPEAPEPPPANAPEGPSPSPAPTAPRSSPTPPPPTLQDVVDAVVAVVGPAVRVSVRAVEHAASQVAAAEARAHRAAAAAKAKKAPPSPEEASAPPVPPRPFIHGHHTCDGCGMRPIVGERYHCVDPDVPDYDLCAACHASCAGSAARRFEVARLERDEPFQDRWAATAAAAAAESQPTTPEPDIAVDSAPAGAAPAAEGAKPETAAAPAPAPRPFIHGRHTCDGCLATPIVGARYHCLDLPDFDLCGSCHASYDGPNRFESLELERDGPFQERWHRRRARWAQRGAACGRRGGGGPGHRRGPGRWGPPHHPPPVAAAPPAGDVDDALREAIRRSLQDLKGKEGKKADAATAVVTEEVPKVQTAPEVVASAPPAAVVDEMDVDEATDDDENTKPAAAPGSPTSRYTVHDDSDDEDAKDEDSEPAAVIPQEPAAAEAASAAPSVDRFADSSKGPAAAAAGNESRYTVHDDSDDEDAEGKVSEPAAVIPQEPANDADGANDISNVDLSVASEFADDAEGNGAVAAALGNMMDMVASCIQEMNAVNGAVVSTSSAGADASGGVKIVDGEDENRPHGDDDNLSLGSDSSSGSWVVDDDFAASPEAMARAAMVIGSSLLSSDMAQSTGNVNPTATSTLTSSSTGASDAVAQSFSSVGSIPSTVPSIAQSRAAASSQQVPAPQLERWAVQLRQLHELGFHDDASLVDIIERLNAANIGVDSTDEVTVQQVVHELMKHW